MAAAVRRIDLHREARLASMLAEAGMDAARAADLARVEFTIVVGSQQLDDRVDRERLGALLDEYERWVRAAIVTAGGTGAAPAAPGAGGGAGREGRGRSDH